SHVPRIPTDPAGTRGRGGAGRGTEHAVLWQRHDLPLPAFGGLGVELGAAAAATMPATPAAGRSPPRQVRPVQGRRATGRRRAARRRPTPCPVTHGRHRLPGVRPLWDWHSTALQGPGRSPTPVTGRQQAQGDATRHDAAGQDPSPLLLASVALYLF